LQHRYSADPSVAYRRSCVAGYRSPGYVDQSYLIRDFREFTGGAALYREVAQAITEGRPAHPGFGTAVHHHRTLAASDRAAQTGVRQPLAPQAGPRQRAAARDHTEGNVA
jgi:hypothetical protein